MRRLRLTSMLALLCALVGGALRVEAGMLTDKPTAPAEDPLRLVMVEAIGCRFCAQWHADIGAAYPQSPEGQFAPLLKVTREDSLLQGLKPVVYTPTFILMRGTAELARMPGYPGKDYFWEELREVLAAGGFAVSPVKQVPDSDTR